MHLRSKLILAMLAATALLATAVGAASARRFSVNERNFELIWNPAVGTSKTDFEIIRRFTVSVHCPVTLLGSFVERTITKETSVTKGNINHGASEACTGGSATVKSETMPWPIRYRSFTGTLPRITSIKLSLIGARFRVREGGGLECEMVTEVNHPSVLILGNTLEAPEEGLETTGEVERVTTEKGAGIPLSGALCQFTGEVEFGGVGLIINLPRTGKVRFILI